MGICSTVLPNTGSSVVATELAKLLFDFFFQNLTFLGTLQNTFGCQWTRKNDPDVSLYQGIEKKLFAINEIGLIVFF